MAARIAAVSANAADLERLARPLLDLLGELTGFESTYVTVLHWEDFMQEVRYARNTGLLEIGEGVVVEWSDTLCRRALLEGTRSTADVPTLWPDSAAASELGITSYVSVPIITPERSTFGTLCAASARSIEVGPEVQRTMELLARLLADQVERERLASEERDRVAAAAVHARVHALAVASSEHKLKTPLAIIRGAADKLAEGGLDQADTDALLGALRRQAVALEACVHDLLSHTRPGTPPSPMVIVPTPLEPTLLTIVSDVRLLDEDRRITLTCADRLSCSADLGALRHVLEHLLENAIKYTPDGSPIEVSAVADGDAAVITVADHGPGLPSGGLFEGFTRGEGATAAGSGLGLHVVRTLVESMHGTVAADETPGGGARFRVRLPRVAPG